MITAFPKIFAIGTTYIQDIFKDDVEVTEKVDGSQFVFGKLNGELFMRSKGTMINDPLTRAETDLFYPAIQHVLSIEHLIPDGHVFYCETLCRPRHNVLKYSRVPKNHLMLFAVSTGSHEFVKKYEDLNFFCELLDIDIVPVLYRGKIGSPEEVHELVSKESVLGGCEAEGVVVKNYHNPFLLGGQPIPVMAGKYVTEKFKEVHRKDWGKLNTGAGKWQLFKESYRTEARWDKAIQHLREAGELENQPRDIGKLIAEVQRDIKEEEKEIIKEFLWNEFGNEVTRTAIRGLPEYYKEKLLESSFD